MWLWFSVKPWICSFFFLINHNGPQIQHTQAVDACTCAYITTCIPWQNISFSMRWLGDPSLICVPSAKLEVRPSPPGWSSAAPCSLAPAAWTSLRRCCWWRSQSSACPAAPTATRRGWWGAASDPPPEEGKHQRTHQHHKTLFYQETSGKIQFWGFVTTYWPNGLILGQIFISAEGKCN